jgi:TolB-like protein
VRSADDACSLLQMQMACDWRAVAAMAHLHRRGHVVVAGRSTTGCCGNFSSLRSFANVTNEPCVWYLMVGTLPCEDRRVRLRLGLVRRGEHNDVPEWAG